MERACVLLKDIFDYTLEEIAELVSSTVGGVKAALNRGRLKLAASSKPVISRREVSPELSRLLHLYVDRFNKRDWEVSANSSAPTLDSASPTALPDPSTNRHTSGSMNARPFRGDGQWQKLTAS
jgi:hypothetical protein